MYLEISNVAAALGKNQYESREKTLLVSWARHCPDVVRNFLIENNFRPIVFDNLKFAHGESQKRFFKFEIWVYRK